MNGDQDGSMQWPTDVRELERLQGRLVSLDIQQFDASTVSSVGACFVCFERGGSGSGAQGDRGWSACAVMEAGRILGSAHASGTAGAGYVPGALAAREGALLSMSIERLRVWPDVLLVNATGRDHPRRAGMATQIGWVHGIPTIGITDRTLVATGDPPGPWSGSYAPLTIDGEQVGWWLRTRERVRPVAISPGWSTTLDSVVDIVMSSVVAARTPEPLRQARRLARSDRAEAGSIPDRT